MINTTINKDLELEKEKNSFGEIIKKAKVLEAEYEGTLTLNDSKINCAVLKDGTRVISQKAYLSALGRSERPPAGTGITIEKLPFFLAPNNLKPFINQELIESITPVRYRSLSGQIVFGYRATTLVDSANVYLEAQKAGALTTVQIKFAEASLAIVRSFAKLGIIALVDEASGYKKAKDEYQELISKFVQEEIRKYVKLFPESWFRQVYRLYGWDWDNFKIKGKNHPSKVGWIINRVVYEKLPAGSVIVKKIRKLNPKNHNHNTNNRDHQFLTDDGREVVSRLIGKTEIIMEDFADQGLSMAQAIAKIDDKMPTQNIPFLEPLL